jgi:hypothetical protein
MNPSPQRKTTKVVTGVLGISGWIGCPKPCKRSDPRMKVTGPLSKKRKLFGFLLNYEKTICEDREEGGLQNFVLLSATTCE